MSEQELARIEQELHAGAPAMSLGENALRVLALRLLDEVRRVQQQAVVAEASGVCPGCGIWLFCSCGYYGSGT